MARGAAGIGRRHHARGRARHHRVHRRLGDELRGGRAAVALHHQDVAVEALAHELEAQAREVAVEHRLDRGVDRRRHAALVLAILRQDGVAGRDVGVGPQGMHDLGGAPLVRGIDVAVQEMDHDGLAAQGQQFRRRVGHGGLVERHQHLAVGIHALRHFEPVFALDQGTEGAAQAVGLRPRAAAELQHVAEALGGDQPDPGDLAFEQRVGRRGRAVHDGLQDGGIDAGRGEGRHEADRLVVDRGRHLGELDLVGAGIDRQKIGEGAADIDADGEGAQGHGFRTRSIAAGARLSGDAS